MKSRNTMTAALLAVLMLLQTLAMGVGAVTLPTPHAHTQESTTAGGTALEPITIAPYINPLYADVITEDDLVKPRDNVPPTLNASGIAEDGEPTLENAVAAMREGLRRREETIVVSAMVSEWTSEAVTALTHEISDKALEHTGVPEEGDYIRWHYGGWRSSTSGSSVAGGYKATVTYTVTYYTTAEQEQAVDAKVDAVLAELDVADADDYTKIKAVYDYICENVTYDYDTLEDDSYKLKYSAYAALINGTAVCQGYAQLLYRFALELGVDARLIAGDGGGPHAWNILELEDLYYNADSTWDAGYSYYNYFLCCPETFTDHIRYEEYDTAEFHAAYPMGEEDYAYHVWDAGVITKEATCAEAGEMTYTCTLCGETRTEEIAVLEHGFVETERIPSTCVEYGVITYTCTVCEATMTEEIPEYAEHSYLDGACEVCGEEDPSFVITGVVIDETNFPDATFRQYVTANFDADSNGALSEDEIAQITAIDVSGQEIESLQGIAYFGALEELYCSDNLLTALDVGGNPALKMLYCDINRLTALDIGNNPALEELYCFDNSLTALDVSHNPALKHLHCSDNRLTTLDVANNPALITLNCSDNLLTALDVGNNTALETLSCSTNQLQTLDVSRNTAVHTLHCAGNRLTALDIRHNTALLYLHCNNNLLTSLDIGGNPVLQILNCDNNQLTALDASNNTAFTKLYCSNTLLTALDVSGCAALDVLICSDNRLTALDVGNNPALEILNCSNNRLTTLDVGNNPALEILNCSNNRLTNIDLSENSLLTDVSFDGNTFEANVSNGAFDLNTLPGAFDVAKTSDWTGGTVNYETGILTVDDGATAVSYVYDTGYTGTADTAKQVTFTLLILIDDTPHTHEFGDWTTVTAPSCTEDGEEARICDGCGESETKVIPAVGHDFVETARVPSTCTEYGVITYTCTVCEATVTEDISEYGEHSFVGGACAVCGEEDPSFVITGVVIDETNFPDATFRQYVTANFDTDTNGSLSEDEIAAVISIDVSGQEIESLQGLAYFGALQELNCSNNLLTALDVSNNTALVYLGCYNNQLTALDVRNNTSLVYLYCYSNPLTALDVCALTQLTTLHCSYNQLTELDVSALTQLTYLVCGSNQLTELDVSALTQLTNLSCNSNQLTELDVSALTQLTYLDCPYNQLTELDVSALTQLTYLDCESNQLTELDVGALTQLTSLTCSFNQLTALDVRNNTALESLYCDNNQLTGLDLSGNTNLNNANFEYNAFDIQVSNGAFDLNTLPGVFDVARTSDWTGGTVNYETGILTVDDGATAVSYVYDTGYTGTADTAKQVTFTLLILIDDTPHTHEYGDWTTVTAPSCTEDGEEARSCIGCGKRETKVIPAVGHDFVETARVPSTCTEYGVITYTCANCDATYTEEIGQLAEHRYIDGVCEMCGEEEPGTEIPDIPTAPAVPEILSCYSKAQTSVKVTWTTVEDADGYELYRTTSPDGTWELKKTVKDGTQDRYTNQGLEIGTTYYYKVRSYVLTDDTLADEIGNRTYSDFSNVSYMPAAVVFDAPYSNATFRVRLRWNEIGGAHGYQIWRMNEDGSYSIVKTLGDRGNTLTNNQGNVTAYSNTGLESGETYTYKMRAFMITDDGRKVFGAYSDEYKVAAMPLAPSATATGTKAGRAVITWEPVNGGAGYQIWMATSEDGTYSIVKSVTDPTVSSYTKYDLESGKTYYFKVRTYTEVDGKKTFGAYSEVLAVTVK